MDRFARRCVPALLAVLVIAAPQAGGAVYRWSAVVTAVIVVTMAVVALARASVRANARVDLTSAVLIGAAAWTALQLLPLPLGLVRSVAPQILTLYQDAGSLPGASARRFVPLTVDVSLTAIEALKWAAYATLYLLILNWPRGGGRQLSIMIVIAAAVTAIVCLVESAFAVPGILGIYRPQTNGYSWLHGPFVNPGHSGIYCAVLGTLCLGLASEMPARLRIGTRVLAVVLLLLALTPLSGKTTVAALAGPAVYFILRARAANWRLFRGVPAWIAAGASAIALVVAIRWLPTPEEIRAMPDRYLALRRYSRLITWSDTWGMIKDFRWTGVGRGGYGAAFTAYDTVHSEVLTWHAENVPIQMFAEWGCIVAPLVLIALAVAVLRAARAARRPKTAAAAAALIMLAIVNLTDFNLELLGMGLTAVLCLGILARGEAPSARSRRGVAMLVAPATLAVVSLAVVATAGLRSPERDADGIRSLTTTSVTRDELDRVGGEAAVRHPADFFLPQLVGAEHLRLHTSLGLPWLNRALTLRPRSPEAHYFVAVALQRAGKFRQALTEYAIAARASHRLVPAIGNAILRSRALRQSALSDPTWAIQDDQTLLQHLADGVAAAGSAADLFRLDERRIQLARTSAEALPAINRQKPLAFANPALLMQLNAAIAVSEREMSGPYLTVVAEVRAKAGMVAEALGLLERAALATPSSGAAGATNEAAHRLVQLLLEQGRAQDALRQVDTLQHRECLSAGEAAFLRGLVQEHLGDHQGAYYSYVQSAQHRPDDVDALVAAARAAQAAAHPDAAREYARRALEAGHFAPAVRERLTSVIGP